MNIAVLGSTRGSNLAPLVTLLRHRRVDAAVSLVVSNREDAGILHEADKLGISCRHVAGSPRRDFEAKVDALCRERHIDLIVLIGFMKIISPYLIHQWRGRIINVHPSLLPLFAGMMDLAIHEAVLNAGHQETGCTVHEVTENLDEGPILVQKKCVIMPNDTPMDVKRRVQELEVVALADAIEHFSLKRLLWISPTGQNHDKRYP